MFIRLRSYLIRLYIRDSGNQAEVFSYFSNDMHCIFNKCILYFLVSVHSGRVDDPEYGWIQEWGWVDTVVGIYWGMDWSRVGFIREEWVGSGRME